MDESEKTYSLELSQCALFFITEMLGSVYASATISSSDPLNPMVEAVLINDVMDALKRSLRALLREPLKDPIFRKEFEKHFEEHPNPLLSTIFNEWLNEILVWEDD